MAVALSWLFKHAPKSNFGLWLRYATLMQGSIGGQGSATHNEINNLGKGRLVRIQSSRSILQFSAKIYTFQNLSAQYGEARADVNPASGGVGKNVKPGPCVGYLFE